MLREAPRKGGCRRMAADGDCGSSMPGFVPAFAPLTPASLGQTRRLLLFLGGLLGGGLLGGFLVGRLFGQAEAAQPRYVFRTLLPR
ncbi:MAG: hypothetical protein IIC53_11445, partial [Proteobacteria bacterium]|nr:hypothetical protein [Pseudomonadota bacterium]